MRQNKWFENPLLNGIEKTDGPVFELIISGKLENFPSVQAVGKSRILLIIFFILPIISGYLAAYGNIFVQAMVVSVFSITEY